MQLGKIEKENKTELETKIEKLHVIEKGLFLKILYHSNVMTKEICEPVLYMYLSLTNIYKALS